MEKEERDATNKNGLAISATKRTELAFTVDNNNRTTGRRPTKLVMEASILSNNNGHVQVRRLHIIYFLSRMGRIDHPHLIRVHHINRNGVYLRDVKRWLSDLRGKDMPQAFAWSYKRRYKSGYVWQDLVDDDLITPISDNEYVLKGSDIFSFTSFGTNGTYDERSEKLEEAKNLDKKCVDQELGNTRRTTSEICQESPVFSSGTSTLTDNSTKQEEGEEEEYIGEQKADSQPHHIVPENSENAYSSSSVYYNLLSNSKSQSDMNSESNRNSVDKMSDSSSFSSSSWSTSSQSTVDKNKNSAKSGTSRMLHNLITCGAVDTDDTVVVNLKKSSSQKTKNRMEFGPHHVVSKGKIVGGSINSFGTPRRNQQEEKHNARKSFNGSKASKSEQQHKQQTPLCGADAVSAAYKPVGAPTCLQCGKFFRPEKLLSHMQSCRGMRAYARHSTPPSSKTSFEQEISNSPHGAYQLIPLP